MSKTISLNKQLYIDRLDEILMKITNLNNWNDDKRNISLVNTNVQACKNIVDTITAFQECIGDYIELCNKDLDILKEIYEKFSETDLGIAKKIAGKVLVDGYVEKR